MVYSTGLGGPLDKAQNIKDVDDIIIKMMKLGDRMPQDQQGLQPKRVKIIEELKEFRLGLSGAEVWTSHCEDTRELENLMGEEEEFPELGEGDDRSLMDAFAHCGLTMPEDLQSLSAEQLQLNFEADLDPDVVADMGEAAVIVLRPASSPEIIEEEFVDLYEEIVGSPLGQVVPGSPGVSFGLSPSHEFHEEEQQQPPKTLQRKPRGKDYQFVEGQEEEIRMIMEKRQQRQKKASESDQEPEPSCALPFLMRKSLGHNCKRLPLPGQKTKKVETEKSSQVNATVYFLRPRKVPDAAAKDVQNKNAEPVPGKKGKTTTEAKKNNKDAKKTSAQPVPEIETDNEFEFEEGSELSRRSQKLLKKMKPVKVEVLNLNLNIHDTGNSGVAKKSKKEAKEAKSKSKVKEASRAKDGDVRVRNAEVVGDEVVGSRLKAKARNNDEEEMDFDVEDGGPNVESNDVHDDLSDFEELTEGRYDEPVVKERAVRRCRLSKKLPVEENDKAYRVISTRAGCRYSLRKLKRTTTTEGGLVLSTTTPEPEPKLKTTRRMTRAKAAALGEPAPDQFPLPRHTRHGKGSKPTLALTAPATRLLTVRESSEKEVILNILKTVASICNLKKLPEVFPDIPETQSKAGKKFRRSVTPGKRCSSPGLKLRSKKVLKSSSSHSSAASKKKKLLSKYAKSSTEDMIVSDSDFD